jgi:hypothetical protein
MILPIEAQHGKTNLSLNLRQATSKGSSKTPSALADSQRAGSKSGFASAPTRRRDIDRLLDVGGDPTIVNEWKPARGWHEAAPVDPTT